MASSACVICEQFVRVPKGEWKYLDHGAFVCCKKCILKWMEKSGARQCQPTPSPMVSCQLSRPDHCYSELLGMSFRSFFEMHVAEWMHESGIRFQYEMWEFMIGVDKWWSPDFWLPDHKCVVEVKGVWWIGARKKLEAFRMRNRHVPVLVIPWVLRHEFYTEENVVICDASG